jgi:hypothetical protein
MTQPPPKKHDGNEPPPAYPSQQQQRDMQPQVMFVPTVMGLQFGRCGS